MLIYPIGCTPACSIALQELDAKITDHPCPEVTHLLLDVPSFQAEGTLRCGLPVQKVLEMLPSDVTVIGGMLDDPSLANYRKIDLLKDPFYLAQNAAITAHCTLVLAASKIPATLPDTQTLILGWGRIGKCLAQLLKSIGASPWVLARKDADRAMLTALGYRAISPSELGKLLPSLRLILNTVPQLVFPEELSRQCRSCVKIDLASQTGIAGPDVISARGLPGRMAPESSGKLIAKTINRLTEGSL